MLTPTCTSIVATTATLDADLYFGGSGDSLSAQLAGKANLAGSSAQNFEASYVSCASVVARVK